MILFKDKKNCCDCNGCVQICPKSAIIKSTDEFGFIYPQIDPSKCIDCGLCQTVCAYQHISETNSPISVYAAVSKDKNQLKKSASGGIFAAIASHFIDKNGVVFGSSLQRFQNRFVVRHIKITTKEGIETLQGSKYLQSDIENNFLEIRNLLIQGRTVLFSGTPCQCAALKGFLKKDYSNLYLIDIICHGVPNSKMFNDFIRYQYKKLQNISGFAFRDKTKGWELTGRIDYENGIMHKYIPAGTNSYYALFLDGQIYRENCYSCKYANSHRPGDITIGDYWGIQKQHPELFKSKEFIVKEGISSIIVNTSKGQSLLKEIEPFIKLFPSEYKKVAVRNKQLLHPMNMGAYRMTILNLYKNHGWKAIDSFYRKKYKKQRYIHAVLSLMPYRIKDFLRKLKH